MLSKAAATTEGIVRQLDPELDVSEAALPYAKQLLFERYSPGSMSGGLLRLLLQLQGFLQDTPQQLSQILMDLEGGKFNVTVRNDDLSRLNTNLKALGLLLFELLTGKPPYVVPSGSPAELIRIVCEQCAEPRIPSRQLLDESQLTAAASAAFNFTVGRGCQHCRGSGYRGRKAIGELFAGFCKDPKDGGLNGINFKVVQSTLIGGTFATHWVASAPFLAEPYKGSDAYITKDGLMQAMVTTFDGAALKMKK